MDSESLPLDTTPNVLGNLLRETYKSNHPTHTLASVLSFYDVTLEQMQNMCGSLYRGNCLEKEHPLTLIVQDILDLLNPNNNRDISPEAYKINLVYVATSIPHLWCKEVTPVVMLDPEKTLFFPYARVNVPVEYVWIHFQNKTHMSDVIQMSDNAPLVSANMLVYDDKPTRKIFSLSQQRYKEESNVIIRIGATETVVSCNEDEDMVPPSRVSDYMVLITRGNAFYRLAEAVLVKPSENTTLRYPLCLHKL